MTKKTLGEFLAGIEKNNLVSITVVKREKGGGLVMADFASFKNKTERETVASYLASMLVEAYGHKKLLKLINDELRGDNDIQPPRGMYG